MICATCGNNEADGAAFCGRCGAAMGKGGRGARAGGGGGGRRMPDISNAAGNLNQMSYMTDKEGVITWLMQRPLFAALGLGAIAAVVAVGAIVFAGGGGKVGPPSANGNILLTPSSGQGGIDLPPTPGGGGNSGGGGAATPGTQPTQQVPPTPEPPQPTASPQPPAPTNTPEPPPPTPTPQPPPPTPTPQPPAPTPTPIPVVVPAEKKSTRVAIAVSNGHGSTHKVGEQVSVCFTAVNTQRYKVYDTATPAEIIDQGVGNGVQKCVQGTVTPPLGADTIRIDALSTQNTVIDFASVSIVVVP